MGSDGEFELPVVDLGGATRGNGTGARAAVAAQLRATLRESQSCHVVNHGVPLELLDELRKRSTEYFSLPKEERYQYHADKLHQRAEKHVGVSGMKEGLVPAVGDYPDGFSDRRETLNCFTRPVRDREAHLWPEMLRESINAYSDAIYGLSTLVLELLSEDFGLPSSAFKVALGPDDLQIVVVNFHPPLNNLDNSPTVIGLGAHTDTTALTILLDNGVPGLQMIQKGGEWATVKPLAGAFLIQTGVFLEVLTNGMLKARLHRVFHPTTPSSFRLGIASGYRTNLKSIVEPLPQLISNGTPLLYKPIDGVTYMMTARGDRIKGMEALDPWKIKLEE